jgi:hypothetical protein
MNSLLNWVDETRNRACASASREQCPTCNRQPRDDQSLSSRYLKKKHDFPISEEEARFPSFPSCFACFTARCRAQPSTLNPKLLFPLLCSSKPILGATNPRVSSGVPCQKNTGKLCRIPGSRRPVLGLVALTRCTSEGGGVKRQAKRQVCPK